MLRMVTKVEIGKRRWPMDETCTYTGITYADLTADAASEDSDWLLGKLCGSAEHANKVGGWNLATDGPIRPSCEMKYQIWGPECSHQQFPWHRDVEFCGQGAISILTYFDEPSTYEGGYLEMKVPRCKGGAGGGETPVIGPKTEKEDEESTMVLQRRFPPGDVVAFPSATFMHRVTPITSGRRRCLLLICQSGEKPLDRDSPDSIDVWSGFKPTSACDLGLSEVSVNGALEGA